MAPTLCGTASEVHRATARPLAVLVHGTWGCRSPWAIPEQSLLVEGLRARLSEDLEFRRFRWSGANRTSERLKATDRLTNELQSELRSNDRPIFVLAHSHGGNIAVRAFDALSWKDQENVRNVLMGTPFLSTGHGFDIRKLYHVLPDAIKQFLVFFWWFAFAIATCVLLVLLKISWLFPGYDRDNNLSSVNQWERVVFMIFLLFAPFLLWIKGQKMFGALHQTDVITEQERSFRDPSRFLAITYSQDEAFQALSLVINMIALIHQLLFICILFVVRLSSIRVGSKVKVADVVLVGLFLVMGASGLLFVLIPHSPDDKPILSALATIPG